MRVCIIGWSSPIRRNYSKITAVNIGSSCAHFNAVPQIAWRVVYISNDINNVTGTANSERLQRTELEKDLVRQLLRRLQQLNYDAEAQPSTRGDAE